MECGAKDLEGYICTLGEGHDGQHVAQATTGLAVRAWPKFEMYRTSGGVITTRTKRDHIDDGELDAMARLGDERAQAMIHEPVTRKRILLTDRRQHDRRRGRGGFGRRKDEMQGTAWDQDEREENLQAGMTSGVSYLELLAAATLMRDIVVKLDRDGACPGCDEEAKCDEDCPYTQASFVIASAERELNDVH